MFSIIEYLIIQIMFRYTNDKNHAYSNFSKITCCGVE